MPRSRRVIIDFRICRQSVALSQGDGARRLLPESVVLAVKDELSQLAKPNYGNQDPGKFIRVDASYPGLTSSGVSFSGTYVPDGLTAQQATTGFANLLGRALAACGISVEIGRGRNQHPRVTLDDDVYLNFFQAGVIHATMLSESSEDKTAEPSPALQSIADHLRKAIREKLYRGPTVTIDEQRYSIDFLLTDAERNPQRAITSIDALLSVCRYDMIQGNRDHSYGYGHAQEVLSLGCQTVEACLAPMRNRGYIIDAHSDLTHLHFPPSPTTQPPTETHSSLAATSRRPAVPMSVVSWGGR